MTAGCVLLVVGLVLVILPGPGLVVSIAALTLLARDVPWAARTLEHALARADAATGGRARLVGVALGSVTLAVTVIVLVAAHG